MSLTHLLASRIDWFANVIHEEMHDDVVRRVFMTTIRHVFDAPAVGRMPFLVMGIVGDECNSFTSKLAVQPIAGLCERPNLFEILLADPGFQGFSCATGGIFRSNSSAPSSRKANSSGHMRLTYRSSQS